MKIYNGFDDICYFWEKIPVLLIFNYIIIGNLKAIWLCNEFAPGK